MSLFSTVNLILRRNGERMTGTVAEMASSYFALSQWVELTHARD